ncbi:DUF2513 domain-containing protein [Niallia taxi]|uniref:DUF2513 domain-containing protein n=1 Tax=Niallia taxi TaxID=2499688 RepID=UPI00316EE546
MKLDHECIRELLLELEDMLDVNESMYLETFAKLQTADKYGFDQVLYCYKRLVEAGYLKGKTQYAGGELLFLTIDRMTWDGHEFLDTIRDNEVWLNTKKRISSVAGVSLQVVSGIATDYLKQKLGIGN